MDEEISTTSNGMASVSPLRTERRSTDAEVNEAMRPLLKACRGWGLRDWIDAPGLAVLGRYDRDDVGRLAAATIRAVHAGDRIGKPIRNPIGWAISKAARCETAVFAAPPPAAPAPPPDPFEELRRMSPGAPKFSYGRA